jgi:hypothetical protein
VLHPDYPNATIALALHDKLWCVIALQNPDFLHRIQSARGFTSKEAAMENMSEYLSKEIWRLLKQKNIALTK